MGEIGREGGSDHVGVEIHEMRTGDGEEWGGERLGVVWDLGNFNLLEWLGLLLLSSKQEWLGLGKCDLKKRDVTGKNTNTFITIARLLPCH